MPHPCWSTTQHPHWIYLTRQSQLISWTNSLHPASRQHRPLDSVLESLLPNQLSPLFQLKRTKSTVSSPVRKPTLPQVLTGFLGIFSGTLPSVFSHPWPVSSTSLFSNRMSPLPGKSLMWPPFLKARTYLNALTIDQFRFSLFHQKSWRE